MEARGGKEKSQGRLAELLPRWWKAEGAEEGEGDRGGGGRGLEEKGEEENRRRSRDDCSLLSVIGFAWPRAQLFTGYCWHFNSYDSNRSRPIVQ